MSKKLTDNDPMPFGKHKGTIMQEVPARYLHWLWINGIEDDFSSPVHHYIKENIDCLREEYTDGIW